MRLTDRVKAWLITNKGVAASSSDDQFTDAAAKSLVDGSLTTEVYHSLCESENDRQVKKFNDALDGISTVLAELKNTLTKADSSDEEDMEEEEAPKKKPGKKKPPMAEDEEDNMEEGKSTSTSSNKGASPITKALFQGRVGADSDDEKDFVVRVKEAAEQYSDTKGAITYPSHTKSGKAHPYAGMPVLDFNEPGAGGRNIDSLSNRDKAVVGAYSKFIINSSEKKSRHLGFHTLNKHDQELLYYAMENMEWNGATDGGDYADIKGRKLNPSEQKALIDDSTSGGLEAAPIVFDADVITTPLLYGELFPLVKSVPIDRGRRIEGVATGTVTGSWGGVDDTAISLFDTTSYVTAFDTTIFRWEGSIRIGLDFLSDTPIDFGAHVTSQYGERLLEDLDDVIATGNGTTQPEGVMNKSGTTSVAFGGSTSIGSYESLRFGVAKPEHRANLKATAVFCGTETSYQRARAIPVGANDARRLGGQVTTIGGVTNYSDYVWMGTPYKINESLTNAQIFYAVLGRYRMYRRRGLTMRTSTEGDTLIRRNEMLIVATARYGGQLERGAVAAVTTTAEA